MNLKKASDFELGMLYECTGKSDRSPMIVGKIYECIKATTGDDYAHLKGPFDPDPTRRNCGYLEGDYVKVGSWCEYFAPLYRRTGCRHEYVPVEFIGTGTVTKNICRFCDMEKK